MGIKQVYAWEPGGSLTTITGLTVNGTSQPYLYTLDSDITTTTGSIVYDINTGLPLEGDVSWEGNSNSYNGIVYLFDQWGNASLKIGDSSTMNSFVRASSQDTTMNVKEFISNITIGDANYSLEDSKAIKEIKTINNQSLIGKGNIEIVSGGFSAPNINNKETLTIGASKTTYTAPASGWFYCNFYGDNTNLSKNDYVKLINTTSGVIMNSLFADMYLNDIRGDILLPVNANDVVRLEYQKSGTMNGNLLFYYA